MNNKRNFLIIILVAIVIALTVRFNVNINITDSKGNSEHQDDVASDVKELEAYFEELEQAYKEGKDTSNFVSGDVVSLTTNGINHIDGTITMLKAGNYSFLPCNNDLGYYISYTCDQKHKSHQYKIGEK